MDFETYEKMAKLLRTHGSQEFGRICQGLLEFTLRKLDFGTRGRWTERPDILAEKNNERYALSSQTSEGSMTQLRSRDLDGILEFKKIGYIPCVAVLIMEPDLRWVIIRASGLTPGEHSKHALRAHELGELTDEVNRAFPSVVEDLFDIVVGRGSAVLRERLA